MEHYLDITVLPDPEFTETVLMNAVFAKLHRVLASLASTDIGVSFPKHIINHEDRKKTRLGNKLRLHASQESLSRLMTERWLTGLRDYTHQTDILPVPTHGITHRAVKRVQVKSSIERLLRRSVTKGWLTEEEALAKFQSTKAQESDLPFIQLKSTSTGQKFRLFISHEPPQDKAVEGNFNTYGLSSIATIPWF
jgi:CRISPR-associated endonuclease Csy4